MALYKLTSPRQFGDILKGYEFQVASATTPTLNAQDVEKEIAILGFNKQAQSYKIREILKLRKLAKYLKIIQKRMFYV